MRARESKSESQSQIKNVAPVAAIRLLRSFTDSGCARAALPCAQQESETQKQDRREEKSDTRAHSESARETGEMEREKEGGREIEPGRTDMSRGTAYQPAGRGHLCDVHMSTRK